jgi:foldase protein PrsA
LPKQISKKLPPAAAAMLGMAICAVPLTSCTENSPPQHQSASTNAQRTPSPTHSEPATRSTQALRGSYSGETHVTSSTLSPATQPAIAARVEEPVAIVNGKPVARELLVKPLVEAYGLNLLLQIVQLELARQDAAKAGVTVTSADVTHERAFMLKGFFPDADEKDYDQLLAQLLKQQGITQPQWDILLQTNACLRKMAEPLTAHAITDENIKQAFDVRYGAQVKIRDIQVANLAEAQEVKRRLTAGEKFEDLAHTLSRDARTAALGGEWPAFAANSTTISDVIKEQAFVVLKPGEVSDVLNTEGVFHIIKLEQKIAPTLAKLDDSTRAYLRGALIDKQVQETIKQLRNRLAQEAMQPSIMQIKDPELKRQFDEKVAEHTAASKEEELVRRQQAMKRLILPAPATRGTTAPAPTEARARPPATRSGAATLPAAPDHPPAKSN